MHSPIPEHADELREAYRDLRVCVTGGAGFIGSHIVDALVALGADVCVIDDFSTGARENLAGVEGRARIVEGSILDSEIMRDAARGSEVIFHQAARTSVPGSIEEPSRYFVERSLQIIRSNPAAYAESLVRKLFLFAHGHELKRNQEIYPFRRYSPVLSGLLWKSVVAWPFGILFPFAVLGMIHSVRERSFGSTMMLLFCVSHLLLLRPFFVATRYRMNIVPFLILFAVYGGSVLLRSARDGHWRTTGGCTLVLVVFLSLSNWRVGEMSENVDLDHYRTLAADLRHEGRGDEADAVLVEARQLAAPVAPGDAIPQRTSTLLVGAGVLALLGYRKLTAPGRCES